MIKGFKKKHRMKTLWYEKLTNKKLCQKYKVELTKKAQDFCFRLLVDFLFVFFFTFIFFKIWHEILIILTEHNLGNLFLIIEIHSPLSHSFQIDF